MQSRYPARFLAGKLACLAMATPLALLPASADASFYSGDELYKVCTAQRGSATYVENTYECIAYITGTIDAFNTIRRTNKLKSCIPEDVTIAQLRKATVTYLTDNPKVRDAPASELVFAATRKAWPCTTKK